MNGNLLIVDDTPATLKLLSDFLLAEGYLARPINNGELALRSAALEPPEVILLDIRMPGMDGFEICRRLKEEERLMEIPVIFISAASDLEDKVKAFQAGGVDYITKPFQREEVIARVKTQVALSRSRQEMKRLNETLEQRVCEEVAKNREQDFILNQQSRLAAMGQMIHNIAHQWKQPINALSIMLGNLKEDYAARELSPEGFGETLKQARSVLERMSATIDDFCNFFRPDRGASVFDIGHAVEQALSIMAASLKNHQIEVVTSVAAGLRAHGYPNQFAHAVLNLIANAKEAIQESEMADGRIEIRLVEEGGKGRLTVQDNGGGIPEEILAKIFDPYVTTKTAGSGIGLYMTKMIIERNLQGAIEAANRDDGAFFIVSLPLASGEPMP